MCLHSSACVAENTVDVASKLTKEQTGLVEETEV